VVITNIKKPSADAEGFLIFVDARIK